MGAILGYDLGTGNSAIAIREGDKTTVIQNSEGAFTTPSFVSFDGNGRCIGRVARSQAAINPTRTVASIKRLMGKLRHEVSEEEKLVPYKVVGEQNEPAQVEIDGKRYMPQEISAMILQDLKKAAEAYTGSKIDSCVICCPAYFSASARLATQEAGQIAGMKVLRVLSEPTSAALAFGVDDKKSQKIAVYDLGSGTFDVSILSCGDGVIEVISTSGDCRLGGNDWDESLANHIADEFQKSTGIDLRKDALALARLREASEKAKCDLSVTPQTTINLPYITASGGTPQHLSTTITRAKFDSICAPLFERLREPALSAIRDSKYSLSDIQEVLLVGGASRMPRAQEICKEIFGREPNKSVNPDLCVCMGAAVQGAILGGSITDMILLDITPLSLGVETQGGIMSVLIPKNSSIPISKSEVFSTASDNQPAVDIHVLQGERKLAQHCRTLGRFQLTGIAPAPRGGPQIEVAFDISVDGIVSVSAKDKATNKEHKVEITSSSGLSKEEIERMVADAKVNETEEAEKVATIEARNDADTLVYYAEKFMKDNSKALSVTTQESVTKSIENLKAVLARYGVKTEINTAINLADIELKKMQAEIFKGSPEKPIEKKVPVAPAFDVGMPEGESA